MTYFGRYRKQRRELDKAGYYNMCYKCGRKAAKITYTSKKVEIRTCWFCDLKN